MSKLLKAYDRSRVPLYIQVASVLRTRIQSGQWGVGEKISTLEELEREFEVARVTVRQAVDILREEGMLQARQGLGTFVSKRNQDRHWVTLATNWNSLIEQLKDNVPRRLSIDRDVAAAESRRAATATRQRATSSCAACSIATTNRIRWSICIWRARCSI